MEQLQMLRRKTAREDVVLPAGYTIVMHQKEYTEKWLELSMIFGGWTPEEFAQNMLGGKGILPEGIFYLQNPEGEIVATSTGVLGQNKTGRLHMVAVSEKCRGLGLGTPLNAQTVNYLMEHGVEEIALLTDDFRIPAIKIYLKLGFLPVLSDDTMLERWRSIAQAVGIQTLSAIQNGEPVENIL